MTGIYSLPGFDGKMHGLLASLLDLGAQSCMWSGCSLPGFDGKKHCVGYICMCSVASDQLSDRSFINVIQADDITRQGKVTVLHAHVVQLFLPFKPLLRLQPNAGLSFVDL